MLVSAEERWLPLQLEVRQTPVHQSRAVEHPKPAQVYKAEHPKPPSKGSRLIDDVDGQWGSLQSRVGRVTASRHEEETRAGPPKTNPAALAQK